MSIFTSLKEKVSNSKLADQSKLKEEELKNLDALIEDLFRLDDQEKQENKDSSKPKS